MTGGGVGVGFELVLGGLVVVPGGLVVPDGFGGGFPFGRGGTVGF